MLEYKGYVGKIAYDDVAEVLYATVINSGPYSIAEAEATDVEGVKREFRKSIDLYSGFMRRGQRRAGGTDWRYLPSPKRLLDSSTPYEEGHH